MIDRQSSSLFTTALTSERYPQDVALARRRQPSAVLPDLRPDSMPDDRSQPPKSWINLVLRDLQFWVPVGVLVVGLMVLRWIS